ncbi:MAG TPA: hypothetical protein VK652_08830 [Steroidobacteraceae bacterium]|nr:hypothetical protein [Steroidobacteraceae bacterium]
METIDTKSGEELLREIDAEQAKAYRVFYRRLAITCAVPICLTAALWLCAVLTQ